MSSLTVFSAGSLKKALPPIFELFQSRTGIEVKARFAPAGVLRGEIENGAACDLYASANLAHPQRLQALGLAGEPVIFARNTECLVMRDDPALTRRNWLELLSDPAIRLATSTPARDPGGDYAMEIFANIEARHPGLGETIRKRSMPLLGGENTVVPAGKTPQAYILLEANLADVLVGYASYRALLQEHQGIATLDIPPEYNVTANYSLSCLNEAARPLADCILSAEGQEILMKNGFLRAIPE